MSLNTAGRTLPALSNFVQQHLINLGVQAHFHQALIHSVPAELLLDAGPVQELAQPAVGRELPFKDSRLFRSQILPETEHTVAILIPV